VEKRYQVFVSSTFHDLELERQEVMHALLELDCMPSGMELFPAANEGPSSFRVESNGSRFLVALGQTGGSRLPVGHPKGLALTRPAAPRRSPKGCRPMVFWPATLTAEGDSPPSRWREGRGEG